MIELYDAARKKWGYDISPAKIKVEHEHIQVKCFGYDQYDPTDYKDYFVLTKMV